MNNDQDLVVLRKRPETEAGRIISLRPRLKFDAANSRLASA